MSQPTVASPRPVRRAVVALLAILSLAAGLTGATDPVSAQDRIRVAVPAGWVALPARQTGAAEVTEVYPAGQSAASWTDQLLIQKYPGGDPITYLARQEDIFRQNCSAVDATPVAPLLEDGMPMAIRTLTCRRIRGRDVGEQVLFKAIRSPGTLFVLSRVWRLIDGGGPAPGDARRWTKVFHAARPCNRPGRPCPAGGVTR